MAPKPSTVEHRRSLLEDAMRIIEAEHGSDLQLDDIARRIATSRRQLQRAFNEIGDVTYREALTRVRMEAAARHLRESPRMPVRAVASAVGYREAAQFAKAFKRAHGVNPSEYRGRP